MTVELASFVRFDSVRRREPDELAQHLALRVRVALDREVVRLEDMLVAFLFRPREHTLSQLARAMDDSLVRCSNSPFVFGKLIGVFPFAITGALISILFVVTVALCRRAYNLAWLHQ